MTLLHTASIALFFKLMWACEQATNTGVMLSLVQLVKALLSLLVVSTVLNCQNNGLLGGATSAELLQ